MEGREGLPGGGPECTGHRVMKWVASGSGPRALAQESGLALADHGVRDFFGQRVSASHPLVNFCS